VNFPPPYFSPPLFPQSFFPPPRTFSLQFQVVPPYTSGIARHSPDISYVQTLQVITHFPCLRSSIFPHYSFPFTCMSFLKMSSVVRPPRPSIFLMDAIPFDIDNIFDIPLTDIDDKVLNNEISTALGVQYLSPTTQINPRATVNGIIFGKFKTRDFPASHHSQVVLIHCPFRT
jgi:hypothetical protein